MQTLFDNNAPKFLAACMAMLLLATTSALGGDLVAENYEGYLPTPFLMEDDTGVDFGVQGSGFTEFLRIADTDRDVIHTVAKTLGHDGTDFTIVGGNNALEFGPGMLASTHSMASRNFNPHDQADVWFSFLMETDGTSQTAPESTSDRDFFQVMFSANAGASNDNTLSVVLDNKYDPVHTFGARAGGATNGTNGLTVPSSMGNVPGNTFFVVGRLAPNVSGQYDTIDLYVNPTTLAQPAAPDATSTYALATPLTSIGRVHLRSSLWEEDDRVYFDEFRVGPTYEDVLARYENTIRQDAPAVYFRFNDTEHASSGADMFDIMQGVEGWTGSGTNELDLTAAGPQSGGLESNNSAAYFDGIGDRLTVFDPGADSVLDFAGGESITMEAWVKINDMPTDEKSYIISKGRNADVFLQNYGMRLSRTGPDEAPEAALGFIFRDETDSDWHIWDSTATLGMDDQWHHLALSYTFGDGGSLIGYLDGQQVTGTWSRGDGNANPYQNDDDLWVGSAQNGLDTSSFDGWIDEVAIYRDILSAETIAEHYQLVIETSLLPGDLNGDGFVGGDDLDIVRSFWGQNVTAGDLLSGDPSNDGFVGGDDLDIVRANWGQGTPPSPTAVPEPSTLISLLALALASFAVYRAVRSP